MIRKTQVDSLKQLTPTVGAKQQTVYGTIIKLNKSTVKATNRLIAKTLGWEINRVTGRKH